MNILYIAGTDPRLMSHGGEQRVHFVWEALNKLGTVYTVYPVAHRWQEKRDDADRVYAVQLERRYSPSWFLKRLLKNWSLHIFTPSFHTSKRIWRLNIPKPDVCIVRPAFWAYSLDFAGKFPVVADMDDIPSVEIEMLMKKGARTIKNRLSLWWLKHMERRISQIAKCIWVADEEELWRFADGTVSFVPNIPIPPLPDFANELGDESRLFFVGSLAHGPNYIALDWFLKNVWEKAKAKFPKLRLDIGGAHLPEEYKCSWSRYPDVHLPGRIEDLRPYYQQAVAVIAPMRVGSGTCLKVMEALRMGRPLLSTQQGLRGIRPRQRNTDNGILPFEDADSFISAYEALLKSDRLDLQRKAVAFVEQRNNQAFIDKAVAQTVELVLGK